MISMTVALKKKVNAWRTWHPDTPSYNDLKALVKEENSYTDDEDDGEDNETESEDDK